MSTPTATTRGIKSKSSKIIILKVSPSKLSDSFNDKASTSSNDKGSRKASISKLTNEKSITGSPQASTSSPEDVKQESPSDPTTTTDGTLQVPAEVKGKKKGVTVVKAGIKRPASALTDGSSKPRAKPPQKKRPRLDGTLTGEATRPWTTPAPAAGHKLGPKANQGAINAGLRALDRSGKPCRKWQKKSFALKSFTGTIWGIPTWGAPPKASNPNGMEASSSSTHNSNSENQAPLSSSVLGSETSRHVAEVPASSPVAATA